MVGEETYNCSLLKTCTMVYLPPKVVFQEGHEEDYPSQGQAWDDIHDPIFKKHFL